MLRFDQWYCSCCPYVAINIADYKQHKATHPTTGERNDPTAKPGMLVYLPIAEACGEAAADRRSMAAKGRLVSRNGRGEKGI